MKHYDSSDVQDTENSQIPWM